MSNRTEIEAQAAEWVARRDSGQWASAAEQDFEAWVSNSTTHRITYLRMHSAWQRADGIGVVSADRDPPPGGSDVRPSRSTTWRIAATVVLTVGTLGGMYKIYADRPKVDYQTAVGARQTLSLPDGSNVTLNTNSAVKVRVDQRVRTVWLDRGEVFFEIAHDPEHPFVVFAGDRRISVLGTRFSVRRDRAEVTVVVVDGRVRIESAQDTSSPSSTLTKNEVLTEAGGNVLVANRDAAQIEAELSWRQGKLVFDNTSIADAAREFNRYNVKQLVINDAAAGSIKIGGRFDVNNVEAFARLLTQGFGVNVKVDKDRIIVSSARTGT